MHLHNQSLLIIEIESLKHITLTGFWAHGGGLN